jgi:excisionase family DNA binding protein
VPRRRSDLLQSTPVMLTPGEVAALFNVDPKTVTRWAKTGKLTSRMTPGGHRRYLESEVRALLGEPARLEAVPSLTAVAEAV